MSKETGLKSKTYLKYPLHSHFLGALVVSFLSASTPAQSQQRSLNCDGGQWHTVPAVDLSGQYGDFNSLNAVAALSSTDVWAVGQWQHFAGTDYRHTLLERWDGTSWTAAQVPHSRLPIALLSGVAALSSDNVWTVGYEENLRSGYRTLIEHWYGSIWTIVQDGSHQGWLTSVVAIAPDDVWAVGSPDYIGNGLIEHWDGTRWIQTSYPMQYFCVALPRSTSTMYGL